MENAPKGGSWAGTIRALLPKIPPGPPLPFKEVISALKRLRQALDKLIRVVEQEERKRGRKKGGGKRKKARKTAPPA